MPSRFVTWLAGAAVLLASAQAVAVPAEAARRPVDGGAVGSGAPAPSRRWLFAEGSTRAGFVTSLTILNPGPRSAHLRLGAIGPPDARVVTRTISATDRLTVRVSTFMPPGIDAGFEVSASEPVVVERTTYFSAAVGLAGPVDGGHTAFGLVAPSTRWLFAEGYTGAGFQQYLTLVNPSLTEVAHVVIAAGGVRLENDVAPRQRVTLDINAAVGPDREVAIEVSSNHPVVAERPTYFSRDIAAAGAVDGGHVGAGAPEPRREWWFAEGFTGDGFQQYLCVGNPGDDPATVDVGVVGDGDGHATITVEPHGRATIDINRLVGPGRTVGLHVASDVPVLAERPTYFRSVVGAAGLVDGGHVALGAYEPATRWLFAAGHTGGRFQEYLSILNPGPTVAVVPVQIVFPSGPPVLVTATVPGAGRHTLDVRAAAGVGRDVALVVGPSSALVVAERSVYFATSVQVG